MRDCDDTQDVRVNSVNERKREAAHRESSMSSVERLADIWSFAEEFRNALRFHQKLGA